MQQNCRNEWLHSNEFCEQLQNYNKVMLLKKDSVIHIDRLFVTSSFPACKKYVLLLNSIVPPILLNKPIFAAGTGDQMPLPPDYTATLFGVPPNLQVNHNYLARVNCPKVTIEVIKRININITN